MIYFTFGLVIGGGIVFCAFFLPEHEHCNFLRDMCNFWEQSSEKWAKKAEERLERIYSLKNNKE